MARYVEEGGIGLGPIRNCKTAPKNGRKPQKAINFVQPRKPKEKPSLKSLVGLRISLFNCYLISKRQNLFYLPKFFRSIPSPLVSAEIIAV